MVLAELQNISKSFGKVRALQDVSLAINPGETVAVLGPNGAGKSTAINVLLGLRRPRTGKALLFGGSPHRQDAKRRIGVTPQDASFPQSLKVRELINFARAHFPNAVGEETLVEAFNLAPLADKFALNLSGGQRRQLAVALAFVGQPEMVFLDEPTTGLDTRARANLWTYFQRYREKGGSVLLTTHYLEEAEALADRVILINQGRIIKEGKVADIKKLVPARIIRFRAQSAPTLVHAHLHKSDDGWHTYLAQNADEGVRELVNSDTDFQELEVLSASLEMAISTLLEDQ